MNRRKKAQGGGTGLGVGRANPDPCVLWVGRAASPSALLRRQPPRRGPLVPSLQRRGHWVSSRAPNPARCPPAALSPLPLLPFWRCPCGASGRPPGIPLPAASLRRAASPDGTGRRTSVSEHPSGEALGSRGRRGLAGPRLPWPVGGISDAPFRGCFPEPRAGLRSRRGGTRAALARRSD